MRRAVRAVGASWFSVDKPLGGVPKAAGAIVQECGIGLVEVRREEGMLAFRAPELARSGPLDAADLAETIRLCGVRPEDVIAGIHAANGPGWKVLHMTSSEAVLAAEPAARAPLHTDVALLGRRAEGDGAAWELRGFFADAGGRLCEDPVTGSLNAAVAQYLFASGQAETAYIAAQGRKVGADGLVHCRREADRSVWVAGKVATVSAGGTVPGPF